MSTSSYGTHPEVLSRLLGDLAPEERRQVRYLDAAENADVEERCLNKFPQTGGSLEFGGAPPGELGARRGEKEK
ncbi:hypothetical protein [Streptomyces sp. NPDC088400]|uniref:hypothetical protein n=1 Tax=Streptomyces sp. NPDC088400 TaxID=3365861 RepID=UPI00382FA565